MDGVIKLNDFLDSMFGMMKKIAMAAVVLLVIAGAIAVSMWPLVSQRPWEFAGAALAVLALGFLVGAAATLLVSRGKAKTQIEARDEEIAELKEKMSELEKRPTQEQLDEALAGSIAPEETEEDRYRQHVLDTLAKYESNKKRLTSYIDEGFGGAVEESTRFAEAMMDLLRYGCIAGITMADVPGGDYLHCGSESLHVIKRHYPSRDERWRMDAKSEAEAAACRIVARNNEELKRKLRKDLRGEL